MNSIFKLPISVSGFFKGKLETTHSHVIYRITGVKNVHFIARSEPLVKVTFVDALAYEEAIHMIECNNKCSSIIHRNLHELQIIIPFKSIDDIELF